MAAGQAIDMHDQINTTGFYVQLGTAQVPPSIDVISFVLTYFV